MDTDFKAQSLEAWKRLKRLSDEEKKRVLTNAQEKIFKVMELAPEELNVFQQYANEELNMDQFLEIMKGWITQFQEMDGIEKLDELLHRTIIEFLPQ